MNELQIFIFGGVVLVSLSAIVLCKLFICNSDSDNRSRRFKRPKFFKHKTGSISGNYENEVDENYGGIGCNDPDLDQLAAVTALLATAVDLVARLNVYLKNTYGFARMCKQWFPVSHQHYVTLFLHEADENKCE